MIIGKVIGSVVATRKDEKLVGSKFLVIEPLRSVSGDAACDKFVAAVAGNLCLIVLWMDSFSHDFHLSTKN